MSDKQLILMLRRVKNFLKGMASDRNLHRNTRDGLAEWVKAVDEAAKRLSMPRRPQA